MKLETANKVTVATGDSTDIIISELPVTGTLSVNCTPADRVTVSGPTYEQVSDNSYTATITVTGGNVADVVAVTITQSGDVLESVVVRVTVEPLQGVIVLDETGKTPGQNSVFVRQRVESQNQANILNAISKVNSKINTVMGEIAVISAASTVITESTVLAVSKKLKELQEYLTDVIVVASKDEVVFNRK